MVRVIVVGVLVTVPKKLEKRPEESEIRGRIETIQTSALLNTQKSPVDLRRLTVAHTPVK